MSGSGRTSGFPQISQLRRLHGRTYDTVGKNPCILSNEFQFSPTGVLGTLTMGQAHVLGTQNDQTQILS